jgi:hypothetical protein
MGGMRNDLSNSGLPDPNPPVVFHDVHSGNLDHGPDHGFGPQPQTPLKTDWRDFVAITLAVYQILLGPLLLIVGGIVGVYLLFLWLAR